MRARISIVTLIALAMTLLSGFQRGVQVIVSPTPTGGVVAITQDATCTGTGSGVVPCSGAMTVTAGDTIACSASGSNNFGDPISMFFNDITNGTYDTIEQSVHPASGVEEVIWGVFANSAGGSITPQVTNWESITLNLRCYAWKGTRTTLVVDGGAVNLLRSATAANPTAGTAAAPTNANSEVICTMVRATTATITGDAAYLPGGTLAAAAGGTSFPVYNQTQTQTTATAVNCPMTASSIAFLDGQFALINLSNSAGTRAFTGVFGVPAIAKTNASSATTADLNGATTTLATTPNDGTGWILNQGIAQTYTTAIAPTGTGHIMLQGVDHTFGDALTSVKFTVATGLTEYLWGGKAVAIGHPMWLSSFLQVSSSGITSNSACDSLTLGGGVTDQNLVLQVSYNATDGVYFDLEPFESGSSALMKPSAHLALDADFRPMIHMAGVNERNHELLVQTKSGGVWSTAQTFTYDILCTPLGTSTCSTPTAQATTTGTASSGATALTVASGTGIVVGQIVLGTNIPDPSQSGAAWTTVTAVAGTAVTLSQFTTGSLSGTTVKFYTPPSNLQTATKLSSGASGGATTLTVTANTYGTIAAGDPIGGSGLAQGTTVASYSAPTITLSQPTTGAISSGGGISVWSPANPLSFGFGRYSTCLNTANETFSALAYDPFNDWGPFVPN